MGILGLFNAEPIPVEEGQKHEGFFGKMEQIDLAFKVGRDEYYFTNKRIVRVDRQGFTGSKKEYSSLPYRGIRAFCCETAGSMDWNVELKVWSLGGVKGGIPTLNWEFNKDKVDILMIHRYLSQRVFGTNDSNWTDANAPAKGKESNMFQSMFNEFSCMDINDAKKQLDGVINTDEEVELAYKGGRDKIICTSQRLLSIDVTGVSGKRIQYLSLCFDAIKVYSIECAGSMKKLRMDRDNIVLFTDFHSDIYINIKSEGTGYLQLIQYFNDKLLGPDTPSDATKIPQPVGQHTGNKNWFGDDMFQLDPTEANEKFHSNPNILQKGEVCEMAFKARRDMVLFTTKRIIYVDPKGLSGKAVNYSSVPYSCVELFMVRTAGSMDNDHEIGVWTKAMYIPEQGSGEDREPPEPGHSYFEFQVRKSTVDLFHIHRYLHSKILSDSPSDEVVFPPAAGTDTVSKFMNFVGSDYTAMSPEDLQKEFNHNLVDEGEKVLAGFKVGRDSMIMTDRCMMDIDRMGITGKRTEILTIPYSRIKSYTIETAGSMDRDCEMELSFSAPWHSLNRGGYSKDLSSKSVDVYAIQSLLANKILGLPGKLPDYHDDNKLQTVTPGTSDGLVGWIRDVHSEADPSQMEKQFKEKVPILQPNETVTMAYAHKRSVFLVTNKRALTIRCAGFTGKRIKIEVAPWKTINAFAVKSASTFSCSTSATMKVSSVSNPIWKQKLAKNTDVLKLSGGIAEAIFATYE